MLWHSKSIAVFVRRFLILWCDLGEDAFQARQFSFANLKHLSAEIMMMRAMVGIKIPIWNQSKRLGHESRLHHQMTPSMTLDRILHVHLVVAPLSQYPAVRRQISCIDVRQRILADPGRRSLHIKNKPFDKIRWRLYWIFRFLYLYVTLTHNVFTNIVR